MLSFMIAYIRFYSEINSSFDIIKNCWMFIIAKCRSCDCNYTRLHTGVDNRIAREHSAPAAPRTGVRRVKDVCGGYPDVGQPLSAAQKPHEHIGDTRLGLVREIIKVSKYDNS